MSDALIWELTKNGNAFLYKKGNRSSSSHRGSHQFTCEPGNLRNVNTFANSGLANSDAIDIQTGSYNEKAGNKVTFGTKNKAALGGKGVYKTFFLRQGFRLSAANVTKRTEGKFYRADLKKAALARYAQLQRVCKVERGPEREGLKGAKRKLRRRS